MIFPSSTGRCKKVTMEVDVMQISVARWSRPMPILVIFFNETSTPSVS